MTLVWAVLLVLAAEPEPKPQPQLSEETVTYEIEGTTSAELRKSLDALGPTDDAGRHDALTSWYVRWHYDFDRGETRCGLKDITTTLTVKFTFPVWPGENAAVGPRWQKYLAALRTHEDGHKKNGLAAANVILAKLKKVPPAADCETVEKIANAAGDKELERARALDRKYDEKTKHGETQGATFR